MNLLTWTQYEKQKKTEDTLLFCGRRTKGCNIIEKEKDRLNEEGNECLMSKYLI